MARPVKVVAAVVLGATVVGGIAFASSDDRTTAMVTKIVDGDTLDVSYDGARHRIRLLNVDTPESVDPDKPVECLGPEATKFLRDRLPIGTEVRLEYDQERHDKYDRELAGVFLGDSLVNADIARAGFGVAMSVAPNTRFLGEVQKAQEEARSAGRGLYSDQLTCTVPSQLARLESAASSTTSAVAAQGAGLEAIDAHASELATVAATAEALSRLLDGDRHVFPLVAFDLGEITRLRTRVMTADQKVGLAQTRNKAAHTAEKARLDAEQRAAEEAARAAAEEAARLAAEEAARQAAAVQRTRSSGSSGSSSSGSRSSTTSSGTSSSRGSGSSSSGGVDTYTGCRAYGPGGTSVDSKGRRYTKIDCVTKRPIG